MTDSPYRLKVKEGRSKDPSIQVKTDALVLGSGDEADVVLQGPGVEPRHARVVFQGGQVSLEDLGTKSGTFRNGQRLLGPVQVFPGDRIGLGPEVVLILEGDDPKQGASENGLTKALDNLADDLGLTPGDTEEA